jgi:hypothetical protein
MTEVTTTKLPGLAAKQYLAYFRHALVVHYIQYVVTVSLLGQMLLPLRLSLHTAAITTPYCSRFGEAAVLVYRSSVVAMRDTSPVSSALVRPTAPRTSGSKEAQPRYAYLFTTMYNYEILRHPDFSGHLRQSVLAAGTIQSITVCPPLRGAGKLRGGLWRAGCIPALSPPRSFQGPISLRF